MNDLTHRTRDLTTEGRRNRFAALAAGRAGRLAAAIMSAEAAGALPPLRESDLHRVAFVELLDGCALPICRFTAEWDGASFELNLEPEHTSRAKIVRLLDRDGGFIGHLDFRARGAQAMPAAEGRTS